MQIQQTIKGFFSVKSDANASCRFCPRDVIEGEEAVEQRGAECTSDMVLTLAPIQTLQREGPPAMLQLRNVNSKFLEPLVAFWSCLVALPRSCQQVLHFQTMGDLNGNFAGEMIITSPRVPDGFGLFIKIVDRWNARWRRDGGESLDETPDLLVCQPVIAMPAMAFDRNQVARHEF